MKIQMLMGGLVVVASGAVLAQPATPAVPGNPLATPRVEQRQLNQERRIEQGVASGQLTQREAARLQAEQGRIQNAEDKIKSDGKVTAQERARMEHMQERSSRHIANEKHDHQRDMDHDGRADRQPAARQHGKRRD